MDIHKLKDLPDDDRLLVLQGEAMPGAEEQIYPRTLTEAEVAAYEKALAQHSIQIAAIKKEIADLVKEYKDKLKPINLNFLIALEAVKNGTVQEKGKVYRIPDYDNKMVHVISEHGTVIQTRQIKPEERQYFFTTQHHINKAV